MGNRVSRPDTDLRVKYDNTHTVTRRRQSFVRKYTTTRQRHYTRRIIRTYRITYPRLAQPCPRHRRIERRNSYTQYADHSQNTWNETQFRTTVSTPKSNVFKKKKRPSRDVVEERMTRRRHHLRYRRWLVVTDGLLFSANCTYDVTTSDLLLLCLIAVIANLSSIAIRRLTFIFLQRHIEQFKKNVCKLIWDHLKHFTSFWKKVRK